MIDWPNAKGSLTDSVFEYICDVAKLGLNFLWSIIIQVWWLVDIENLVLNFRFRDVNSFILHNLYDFLIQEVEIDALYAHNQFVRFCNCF